MAFDRKVVDKKLRATGDVLNFIVPYYTKPKMKIINSFARVIFRGKRPLDVKTEYSQVFVLREDQSKLRVCVYSNKQTLTQKSVALIWFHGGGFAMNVPEQDYVFFKNLIKKYNVVVFAPDYTKSTEKPFPAAFEDAKKTLEFVKNHAENFGVSADSIFVGGDSAGGGLAFALSLYARDVGDDSISYVISIYPMINHKHTQTSKDNNMPIWNTRSNEEAWKMYIGDFDKTDPYFKYASPSVEEDYSNLPPVFTYVGTEDPFYAETIEMIAKLKSAGVPVSFKIFEGCYHGFDIACPLAPKSKEAKQFLIHEFGFACENYIKQKRNKTDEKD